MRKMLFSAAIAASAIGAPALAQPYYADPVDARVAASIPSPREAEAMGHTVGRAADALMDMPVGDVVNAISPNRRVHPGTTLGDVAGRGDPYARARMHDQIGALSYGMGEMAARVGALAPVLHRSMIDLEQRMAYALRGYPSGGGYYDEGYDPYDAPDYRDYYDYDD